jgi:site-specific recombinase XerC
MNLDSPIADAKVISNNFVLGAHKRVVVKVFGRRRDALLHHHLEKCGSHQHFLNPQTRRAYARAAVELFDWLKARGVTHIAAVESVHVAVYIEQLQTARSAPTTKLRLAALPHLFDRLVVGQIMPVNPAAAVRGPRHIVRCGKTPVLDVDWHFNVGL